jgi:hypothetical protein
LLNKILIGANNINEGRRGLSLPGKEGQGRITYEDGIALALSAFQDARNIADPQTFILAETAFLNQELEFCDEADADTRNSLIYAIRDFRDAMRCLAVVEDKSGYKYVEKTYSTNPKKRVQGFPLDVFHQACISHRTRLRNSLRTPGINMREKTLLEQRMVNMKAAPGAYVEKQRRALAG